MELEELKDQMRSIGDAARRHHARLTVPRSTTCSRAALGWTGATIQLPGVRNWSEFEGSEG